MAKTKMSEADELRMRIKRVVQRSDEWARTPEGQEYDLRLEFANRLAAAMKSKKMTQADLCAVIGMKQPQLSRIMAGDENVTLTTIDRLARGLGIDPGRLVHRPKEAAASK